MSDSSAIRIVHPREFDRGTLQTPGSERLAAVAPQLGIETTLWGGLIEVKQSVRTGIHHHSEQQTIATCCQAYAKYAGARTANSQPAQRPAISFTCLRSCRTWRSIRQIRNRSDGSWCEARRLRSWSIFQRTRGDRFQTLGMRPWVSRFTITRNDGSKPGTKAHLDETDTQAFRLPDERFGRSVLSRPLSCSGVFRGSRYPPRHRMARRQSSSSRGTAT
jgi:hypothetical protein